MRAKVSWLSVYTVLESHPCGGDQEIDLGDAEQDVCVNGGLRMKRSVRLRLNVLGHRGRAILQEVDGFGAADLPFLHPCNSYMVCWICTVVRKVVARREWREQWATLKAGGFPRPALTLMPACCPPAARLLPACCPPAALLPPSCRVRYLAII